MSEATAPGRVALLAAAGPGRRDLVAALEGRGFAVDLVADAAGAREGLAGGAAALVLDLATPRLDAPAVIGQVLAAEPLAPVLVLADPGDEERVLHLLERGALEVLVRPVPPRRLDLALGRAAERRALAERLRRSEAGLAERFAPDRIVGESRGLVRAREALRSAAREAGPVLLVGAEGTGKGLFARVLHQAAAVPGSASPAGEFRTVAARALGLPVDPVPGGTLLVTGLDEPDPAAARVARALFGDGGTAEPRRPGPGRLVGAATTPPAGVGGTGTRTIHLPPLREREGDVALLADHFLRQFNREHSRRVTGITRGALTHLETWDWPGNVRELRAAVESMVVFVEARRPLDVSDLPLRLRQGRSGQRGILTLSLDASLAEAEKCFLQEVLRSVGYDRARAAETLGIGLRTLYRKLKEYEIG